MTCNLNVCIGGSLINNNSHHPVTSATLTGDRLFCVDDVVCRDAFRCNLLTQTHTVLPSCRATCATSRHTYHTSSQWPSVHITLQMQFVNTNTHCPAFPSCYMCYLSSHISHQFTMAVCPHYPRSYLPIEYFNSQFQWTMVAKEIKLYLYFPIGVTAFNILFQNKKVTKSASCILFCHNSTFLICHSVA